ncbi:MAG: haloacid dehalogenase type II [Gammaproteobacteria bacterium]|nr:haloacid dehalogenase type II [Gammaproteobacteria bacterium]
MSTTLAFDVYGTLIDTHGVVSVLREMIGDEAEGFSQSWRDKQLEYSFRRGLMRDYKSFAVCTANALDYTCALYQADISQEQKQALLAAYRTLPAFEEVEGALTELSGNHCRLFAFSNGTAEAVERLLVNAGIRKYFEGIVSVDEIQSFKPDPAVYRHFLQRTGASDSDAWLVSSNPFDVIGAINSGMRAAWVKRSTIAIFDPWGIEPTLIVESLTELYAGIGA